MDYLYLIIPAIILLLILILIIILHFRKKFIIRKVNSMTLQDKNDLLDTLNGLTVYFTFCRSHRKYSFFKRLVRSVALTFCRIYCKWFNYVTRPFEASGDKILFLYYYLPFTIRNIFSPKKNKQ